MGAILVFDIGNLSLQAAEAYVQQACEAFGQVQSMTIIKDRAGGEARGFGFVEMPDTAEAQAAMTGLAGKDLPGQALIMNEARGRGPIKEISCPKRT